MAQISRENMVKWVITSGASYDSLATKDVNTLYFIKDRSEIFKGNIPFASSVILVDEFPVDNIALKKVYFNTTTFESKVYDGYEWHVISEYREINSSINKNEETSDNKLATIGAIKSYIEDIMLNGISTVLPNIVSNISSGSKSLLVTEIKDSIETSKTVPISGFIDNVIIESGILKFSVAGQDNPIEISLPKDNFIKSGMYDSENKQIILTLNTDDVITIDATDLVDIYTVSSTNTIDMSMTNNSISANVKISNELNNSLEAKDDGLYVKNNINSLEGVENNTILVNDNGNVSSGQYQVGGDRFSEDGVNKLATESAVKTYLEENDISGTDQNAIHKDDILTTPSTEPSDDKILSEKAIVSALSWGELL